MAILQMPGKAGTIPRGPAVPGRLQTEEAQQTAQRILGEFREMPGLKVTLAQGCRLWALTPDACRPILDALVSKGFLKHTGGHYRLK